MTLHIHQIKVKIFPPEIVCFKIFLAKGSVTYSSPAAGCLSSFDPSLVIRIQFCLFESFFFLVKLGDCFKLTMCCIHTQ